MASFTFLRGGEPASGQALLRIPQGFWAQTLQILLGANSLPRSCQIPSALVRVDVGLESGSFDSQWLGPEKPCSWLPGPAGRGLERRHLRAALCRPPRWPYDLCLPRSPPTSRSLSSGTFADHPRRLHLSPCWLCSSPKCLSPADGHGHLLCSRPPFRSQLQQGGSVCLLHRGPSCLWSGRQQLCLARSPGT